MAGKKQVSCPVETTLSVIEGRWKVMIIHQLLTGTKRFNQLQRELNFITHRTLTKQLRELQDDRIVKRKDYHQIPPRVEYSLTPLGLSLKDILMAMDAWARQHGHKIKR